MKDSKWYATYPDFQESLLRRIVRGQISELNQASAVQWQARQTVLENGSGTPKDSVIAPLAIGDDPLPQTAHTSLTVDG
eukprot:COSAG02_NODE_1196_length_13929_cov_17.931039_3_plen_79_part_00